MRPPRKTCVRAAIAAVLVLLVLPFAQGLAADFDCDPLELLIGAGTLAVGMAFSVPDALLVVTKALPNGANTIYSDGFDLGHGLAGDLVANVELKLTCPALTTGELADTQTITYSLEHDTASGFGTTATIPGYAQLAVQTGAGGAGAAAQVITVRLPVDVKRYVRVKAVKAGASNASTKSLTAELLTSP